VGTRGHGAGEISQPDTDRISTGYRPGIDRVLTGYRPGVDRTAGEHRPGGNAAHRRPVKAGRYGVRPTLGISRSPSGVRPAFTTFPCKVVNAGLTPSARMPV